MEIKLKDSNVKIKILNNDLKDYKTEDEDSYMPPSFVESEFKKIIIAFNNVVKKTVQKSSASFLLTKFNKRDDQDRYIFEYSSKEKTIRLIFETNKISATLGDKNSMYSVDDSVSVKNQNFNKGILNKMLDVVLTSYEKMLKEFVINNLEKIVGF